MQASGYSELIQKLEKFIRKYHTNQLLRGVLITIGLALSYFLVIALLEGQFYFDKTIRKVLFYSFLTLSLGALGFYVVLPLLSLMRIGKSLSHDRAARIIGDHFPEIQDKLINILQLHETNSEDNALIAASIDQKTRSIKPVPFSNAVDYSSNKRYLRYALPPLLLFLFFLFAAPSWIKPGTERLVKNNQDFERKAPFTLSLSDDNLQVVQYDDYTVRVRAEGDVFPEDCFIHIGNFQYRMNKEEPSLFSYTFKNVQKDIDFEIHSGLYESRPYTLDVLYKPLLTQSTAFLNYPGYTGLKDELVENRNDFVVPRGTTIDWTFETKYVDDFAVADSDAESSLSQKGEDSYALSKRILRDQTITLAIQNEEINTPDSITISITTTPDNHPNITARQFVDSLQKDYVFFAGQASDDYGLSRLSFNYQIVGENGDLGELVSAPLRLQKKNNASFEHAFDIKESGIQGGEKLNYYFEVWDNDAVSGPKSSRSKIFSFSLPSEEELEQQADANEKEIKSKLSENRDESSDLKNDIKKVKDQLLEKKDVDWKTKKEMEKLIEKQKKIQEQFNKAQEKLQENIENQTETQKPSEELQKKQEKLQEVFEEAENKELQDLMKKVEELMQDMEKQEALEMLEEMEQSTEEMEFNMERALEMYKQLEVELELEKEINELEKLAEEQQKLGEETEKLGDEKKNEEQQEKQEEINEKFEKIQEKLDEIEKKNEELKSPKNIEDQTENEQNIEKDQKQSMKNMQEQKNNAAGQKQKQAGEKMQQMADGLKQALQQGGQAQMQEDIEMLRQLLENLLTLSFEQETLINSFRRTRTNTPRYTSLTQSQKNIKDDFSIVEDSLKELSQRVFQLESFIIEKVGDINSSLDKSLDNLEERKKTQASGNQQKTMTSLNDLALMLDESMQQMQQQMAQSMPSAQCNNPGNNPGGEGNVPMDKITKAQEKLNEKMGQQKNGKNPGDQKGGKEGEKGGQNNGPSAKDFAEMAAEQAAIRKALEAKRRAQAEKGKGSSKELEKLLEEMDKTETDLVNKKLTNEMLKRQQDILTRLLEEERAEREREFDKKRQSEASEDVTRKFPPSLEQYLKEREADIDRYKTVSPELKAFYKQLVEEYYMKLNK